MKTIIIAISFLVAVIGCGAPAKTVHPTPRNQQGIDFNQTGTVSIKTAKRIQSAPVATVDNLLARGTGTLAAGNDNLLISTNVELRLSVLDTDEATESINDISAKLGGLILLSNNQMSEVRVPADSLDEFVKRINNLGRPTFRQVGRRNVTDHHGNQTINLENAEKARQRFLELMKMAETVDEVIKIEKELARESSHIARMKRDLQSTKNQIEYARVKIHISSPSVFKPGPVGFVFYNLYKGAAWLFVHD